MLFVCVFLISSLLFEILLENQRYNENGTEGEISAFPRDAIMHAPLRALKSSYTQNFVYYRSQVGFRSTTRQVNFY